MNEDLRAFGWLCSQVVKTAAFAFVLWLTIYWPAVFIKDLAQRKAIDQDNLMWSTAIIAILWAIFWILS